MSSEGVMSGSLKVELDRARIKVNVCRVGRMKAAQANQQKTSSSQHCNVPTRGIEPRTSGLQDLRSTTELYGPREWCQSPN